MTFTLPDLPYDYDALEDYIDEKTMRIHHDKHHAGYVRKLNLALEDHKDFMTKSITEILSNIEEIPEEIRQNVINNGGGHANHTLFWEIMSPDGGGTPKAELAEAINDTFGGFEKFKEEFSNAASSRFGSGWAWLVKDGEELKIVSTANQDSPYLNNQTPILGIDVWEHAYYLNYQNERGSYIENWWNVVNWDQVEENFKK
jgi:Fe-Mn family superoxide dismutase